MHYRDFQLTEVNGEVLDFDTVDYGLKLKVKNDRQYEFSI